MLNLIQNTSKSYKNVSHNTGSKILQTVHIIIQKELQYNKHLKINPNLIHLRGSFDKVSLSPEFHLYISTSAVKPPSVLDQVPP